MEIEKLIERHQVGGSESEVNGVVAYFDDDLPKGWARISDGQAQIFGDRKKIIQALDVPSVEGGQRCSDIRTAYGLLHLC